MNIHQSKIHTSPIGIICDPYVNEPDRRFHPVGQYSIKLRVPEPEALGILNLVKTAITEFEPKKSRIKTSRASLPYYWELNENIRCVVFKFGCIAKLRSNNWIEQKPRIFDLKGQSTSVEVNDGTIGKVAFQMVNFNTAITGYGVLFRLCAVQIIEPAPEMSFSANDYGF